MSDCVTCRDVSKAFGRQTVLDRIDWNLPKGSLSGLLGASGAGKTTLARILAGLDRASSGVVRTPATGQAGRAGPRGAIGMVFQDLALWPHLTVLRHLECVLTNLRRSARRLEAERLLAEVQLPARVWGARPGALSGGEAQRLALARALATRPQLLLLDEPLNQVDLPLRGHLLRLIEATVRNRGITLVYVTHSWEELADVCERAAVLVEGRLERSGSIERVYAEPGSARVARFTGPVIEVSRRAIEEGRILVDSHPALESLWEADQLVVRPQQLRPGAADGRNCWTVRRRVFGSGGYFAVLESEACSMRVPWEEAYCVGRAIGLQVRGEVP